MSDLESLFAVVCALYLVECVHWVRKEAIGFVSFGGRWFRALEASRLPGNEVHGILPAMPLPPLGSLYVCEPEPFSLGPDGALAYVAHAPNPGVRPLQTMRFVSAQSLADARAEQREVRIGGAAFVRASSPAHAEELAARLARIARAAAPDERARAIDAELDRALDVDAVQEKLALFRRASAPLRWACNALWVHLFVVCPSVVLARGFTTTWPALIGGLLALDVVCAALVWRAHRVLDPRRRGKRWAQAALTFCSPPGAVRACDALSRDLLCAHHPLAVARVLCAEETFRSLAVRTMRDALHPIPPACPPSSPEARATEAWWRARRTAALERWLARSGVTPSAWLDEPSREFAESASYCPRCTREYALLDARCYDCFELPTIPFGCAARVAATSVAASSTRAR